MLVSIVPFPFVSSGSFAASLLLISTELQEDSSSVLAGTLGSFIGGVIGLSPFIGLIVSK